MVSDSVITMDTSLTWIAKQRVTARLTMPIATQPTHARYLEASAKTAFICKYCWIPGSPRLQKGNWGESVRGTRPSLDAGFKLNWFLSPLAPTPSPVGLDLHVHVAEVSWVAFRLPWRRKGRTGRMRWARARHSPRQGDNSGMSKLHSAQGLGTHSLLQAVSASTIGPLHALLAPF